MSSALQAGDGRRRGHRMSRAESLLLAGEVQVRRHRRQHHIGWRRTAQTRADDGGKRRPQDWPRRSPVGAAPIAPRVVHVVRLAHGPDLYGYGGEQTRAAHETTTTRTKERHEGR